MAEQVRLPRLTAIVTQLQTKRLVTAPQLAEKFGVSVRTIYRDIRALEASGVPILTEEGKGYALMEGYRLPPVMFTEEEAHALITAEQLILKNKDASLATHYVAAIDKIKAVLRYNSKDSADFLAKRILVRPQIKHETTSNVLLSIQSALAHFKVVQLTYHTTSKDEMTERRVEPFALYNGQEEDWVMVAWCRLRKDFRMFRLDKIRKLVVLNEHFTPHEMTMQEFMDNQRKKRIAAQNTPDIPLS
jgi:predicted DNA-binding transcriptional regulator YafY